MFSIMLFIFLCFFGILAVLYHMLRSQEKLCKSLHEEHAQMRVMLRSLESRLDDLDVAAPAAAVNDTGKAKSCDSVTNVSSQDLGPCMQCGVCQWVYDPEKGEPVQGVEPGTPWSCVPDNFLCPECSLGKDVFDENISVGSLPS